MGFKLSLHSHEPNFKEGSLTKQKDACINFLKKLFRRKGSLVLGITNSKNNKKYEHFLKLTKTLPKEYSSSKEYSDYFFSLKYKKKIIYFVKTYEVETEKGHILLIGYKGKLSSTKLKEVLRSAHKQKAIIIANHPLHSSVSYFLITKALGEDKIGLNKKELSQNKEDFDAIELNSYFPEDWKNIKKLSKKIGIPLVSDSDAHFPEELFRAYYEADSLNFKNPKEFKASLKKSLKKGIHLRARKHRFYAEYKHGLEIIIHKFLSLLKIK